MEIKCEICCINKVQVKDYRNTDEGYCKYFVCPNCFMLNDRWFFRLRHAKEGIGKKRIISKIIEGTWKDYLITT